MDLQKKNTRTRDLIIILGIITGLVAYIVPVYNKTIAKWAVADCGYSIRQLCMGIEAYSQDYDHKTPPSSKWSDAIFRYVRYNTDAYYCHWASQKRSHEHPASSAFSLYYKLDRVDMKNIAKPELTPMFFDSSGGWNSALPITDAVPRHSAGYNCGFLDGHIKWVNG